MAAYEKELSNKLLQKKRRRKVKQKIPYPASGLKKMTEYEEKKKAEEEEREEGKSYSVIQ